MHDNTVNTSPFIVLQWDTVPDGTRVLTSTTSGGAVHSIDLGDEHVPNLSSCQLSASKLFDEMPSRSTVVRWPPMKWDERQLWPPPSRVGIKCSGEELRPTPWPSLICYPAGVQHKQPKPVVYIGVTVRGRADEEAVICTPSATYAMKLVGTSNSVFLIPPGEPTVPSLQRDHTNGDANAATATDAVASVIKVASGSIELVRTAPQLDKLRNLLDERPYVLDEDLGDGFQHKKGLYTWQDLCELVQASDGELSDGLNSLSAVEIDGFWRTADANSVNTILDMILHNSVLHDWPLNAMPETDVLSVMESDGFMHKIVTHCLNRFGMKVEQEARSCWSLDERRVCLQFARRALVAGKMKLDSFMDKWERSIPSGMHTDLQMLEGEVLCEKLGPETWVHAFRVADLH